MNIRESSYGYWSSNRAFLWVAGGAAMGIGNVARLPYLMGEYGGVVFLAAYLIALLLVGLPLLTTEWMLGRWMRDDLVNGFARLVETAKAQRVWIVIGALSLVGAALILSFYSVVAGWSAAYVARVAGGVFSGADAERAHATFLHLAQDPERSLTWHTLFMVVTCIVVAQGVRDGIEQAARRLVPTAFILSLLICAYALMHGDGKAALAYLLTPDFHKFGWRGAVVALNQAFFTLGLGMGVMMAMGSYLPASAPLKRMAVTVIMMDTIYSLVAGVAVFALIFSANLQPTPGLALIFEVLPRALPAGPAGTLIGVAFFVMLLTTTLMSAVTLLEPVARFIVDWQRTTRAFAAVWSAVIIWLIGIFSLLCFSVLQDVRVLNRNFFEWLQILTSNWFAPTCGLLLCIFAARIMPVEMSRAAFGERDAWLYGAWKAMLRYPARIFLIVVLVYSAGLLDWLTSLWGL